MTRTDRAILITGANSGIGKEIARQLALRGAFSTIFLACRNLTRAASARSDLERATNTALFEILHMDVADPGSVQSALDTITKPLHTVVLNAGGLGGPKPLALNDHGVTEVFAANVLGHVMLLEALIQREMLTAAAVLTGSEAARGVVQLRIPPQPSPTIPPTSSPASSTDPSTPAGAPPRCWLTPTRNILVHCGYRPWHAAIPTFVCSP